LNDLAIDRPIGQFHHPSRRIGTGDEPTFDFLACGIRGNATDLGNIHGRKKRRKEIDLSLIQHTPKHRELAADIPFWIDGMNNKCKGIHRLP
jgi:hypothetical protein